jgi:spore coat protein H
MTPARRNARIAVWVLFGLVLFARFVLFKDEHRPFVQHQFPWQERQQRQFRRPPTPVHPPVAQVPLDFPRLRIEISPEDVSVLRDYFWTGPWQGRRQQQRPEVMATVREGDTTYTNVAMHIKGAAGSFRPFDDKPALTLNFNKHARGQKFHGYTKVSLNNSVQDPTFLCEAISREIYNAAGVPAPEARWATLILNERDLGLYVMVEGYGKEFLRRHFTNVKGNLYDGGFVQDIDGALGVNSGDKPEDRSDLQKLSMAASQASVSERWAALNEVLDVDRFVTLVALEIMLCHWDGYALNRNNYRVFHDLEFGRLVFMPHGLDQMFDYPPGRFPPEGSIHPDMRGKVARAVLSTPEGGRLYRDRMQNLLTNVFREDILLPRVQEMNQQLRPTLEAYSPGVAERHQHAVNSLSDRISRRIQSVAEQLARPREVLQFDASGAAPLTQWRVGAGGGGGASNLRSGRVQEGERRLLHLSAANRGGTGSWRSRVHLESGQYRFEGRARASAAARGGNLSLRLSGDRPAPHAIDTTDWIPLSYTFHLEGLQSEVVLVCEFSSPRGEAWFDLDSLRLVKE